MVILSNDSEDNAHTFFCRKTLQTSNNYLHLFVDVDLWYKTLPLNCGKRTTRTSENVSTIRRNAFSHSSNLYVTWYICIYICIHTYVLSSLLSPVVECGELLQTVDTVYVLYSYYIILHLLDAEYESALYIYLFC